MAHPADSSAGPAVDCRQGTRAAGIARALATSAISTLSGLSKPRRRRARLLSARTAVPAGHAKRANVSHFEHTAAEVGASVWVSFHDVPARRTAASRKRRSPVMGKIAIAAHGRAPAAIPPASRQLMHPPTVLTESSNGPPGSALTPPCPACHRIDRVQREEHPGASAQWFVCGRCGRRYTAPPRL